MTPYADTNFYTRIYLQLPESAEADRLLHSAKTREAAPLPLTWLHRVEILNAFQLHVFQAANAGQSYISAQQAAIAYGNFRNDIQKSEFLRPVALAEIEVERQFEELALRRTTRHGFRTYDLLHVSFALLLGCDTFWSFDAKAAHLAKLEGLKVR
ncbi:MAG: type II toxin-antitoxin system VapC family toxin [Acidobacteria bacterium]|nr:type II toxin-antitoxin system VapC family toxin [Acidobacteriota bacterium]